MWDEIIYLFPNFTDSTVEVWEWTSNFIPHSIMEIIVYKWWDLRLSTLVRGAPCSFQPAVIRWYTLQSTFVRCLSNTKLAASWLKWCCLAYTVKPLVLIAPNPKAQIFLGSSCSCLRSIHWSQVLSWEWRCSWSNADRRCSNYLWVISNFISY